MNLESALRIVPNFPKEGVEFLDISPLLEDPQIFKELIGQLAEKCKKYDFNKIVAIESRGFILGSALALEIDKGFAMVRKKGKLPGETISQTYDLEYGTDTIEMLPTSLEKGEKVLLLDDVLATGGTAAAACDLINKIGAETVASLFFVELGFLNGREKLKTPIETLVVRS